MIYGQVSTRTVPSSLPVSLSLLADCHNWTNKSMKHFVIVRPIGISTQDDTIWYIISVSDPDPDGIRFRGSSGSGFGIRIQIQGQKRSKLSNNHNIILLLVTFTPFF